MKPWDSEIQTWQEILDVLERSGMTDYRRSPELYMAWKTARDTHDLSLLEEILHRDPWILKEAKTRTRDFPFFQPKREELAGISGGLSLGYVDYELNQAGLDFLDFTRGLFVCGETGSGKSYPVLRMIDQVLCIPREERRFNLLIVQAVKRDADFLIRKHGSLRVIEWNDFRRAPLQVDAWDSADAKIKSFCGVFSSVNWLMIHSQPLFKRAILRCFEKQRVHKGGKVPPNFSEILDEIDPAAKELRLDGYEHRNVRDHLKFVCYAFIETKGILNCSKGFTVQDFFSKEDVVLNMMVEENDYVIGTVCADIFRDLQRFYEKHPLEHQGLRTLIIVDECRRLFPAGNLEGRHSHDPHTAMRSFVTTRRSSGIGLIAVTQEPESAPSWLVDNSAFVLAFPIGGNSQKQLKDLLNLTPEQACFMDRLPKQGTGVFRDRRFSRPYIVQVPSDLEVEAITLEEVSERMRLFMDGSHEALEPEGVEFVDIAAVENQGRAQVVGGEILRVLRQNRFFTHTQVRETMKGEHGYGAKTVDRALEWLKEQEFVAPTIARASKTKDATYFPLTRKAQVGLGVPESQMTSVTRFRHDLYCERVRQFLVSEGFEAVREYSEGVSEGGFMSAQQGTTPKRIDVLAFRESRKVAYEITLSLSNLFENIDKCLNFFQVDELYIVTERKDQVQDRAVAMVSEHVPGHLLEKITFVSMTDFL